MPTKLETILPWQKITNDGGYQKLDLQVIVDDDFGPLIVRRLKPSEEHSGDFAVFNGANAVSTMHHASRADAQAEAERYFYAQPRFAGSSKAKLLNASIQRGKDAYLKGLSVYKNPNPLTTVDHAQWLNGWLEAYAEGIGSMIVEQHLMPTAKANAQLEHDLTVTMHRLEAWNVVIDFAMMLADAEGDYSVKDGGCFGAVNFIRDFRKGDVDLMSRDWPEWSQYLADKRLGPPPETDADPIANEEYRDPAA